MALQIFKRIQNHGKIHTGIPFFPAAARWTISNSRTSCRPQPAAIDTNYWNGGIEILLIFGTCCWYSNRSSIMQHHPCEAKSMSAGWRSYSPANDGYQSFEPCKQKPSFFVPFISVVDRESRFLLLILEVCRPIVGKARLNEKQPAVENFGKIIKVVFPWAWVGWRSKQDRKSKVIEIQPNKQHGVFRPFYLANIALRRNTRTHFQRIWLLCGLADHHSLTLGVAQHLKVTRTRFLLRKQRRDGCKASWCLDEENNRERDKIASTALQHRRK